MTDEESDVDGDERSYDKSRLGLAVGFPRTAHHIVVFCCVSGDGTTGALKLKRLLLDSFKSERNGQHHVQPKLISPAQHPGPRQSRPSMNAMTFSGADGLGSEAIKRMTVPCATRNWFDKSGNNRDQGNVPEIL